MAPDVSHSKFPSFDSDIQEPEHRVSFLHRAPPPPTPPQSTKVTELEKALGTSGSPYILVNQPARSPCLLQAASSRSPGWLAGAGITPATGKLPKPVSGHTGVVLGAVVVWETKVGYLLGLWAPSLFKALGRLLSRPSTSPLARLNLMSLIYLHQPPGIFAISRGIIQDDKSQDEYGADAMRGREGFNSCRRRTTSRIMRGTCKVPRPTTT